MNCSLDANAMIALLKGEQGSEVVANLLADSGNTCFAHALNMCEVYYDFLRAEDEQAAIVAVEGLVTLGVVIREDMDAPFWKDAGRIKAIHRRVSIADCVCIALARRLDAELFTTDHREFDPLVPLGLCT